jgi:hypothetical protein
MNEAALNLHRNLDRMASFIKPSVLVLAVAETLLFAVIRVKVRASLDTDHAARTIRKVII